MPPWLEKLSVWIAMVCLVGVVSFFVTWNLRQSEWIWDLRERILRLEFFYEHGEGRTGR